MRIASQVHGTRAQEDFHMHAHTLTHIDALRVFAYLVILQNTHYSQVRMGMAWDLAWERVWQPA